MPKICKNFFLKSDIYIRRLWRKILASCCHEDCDAKESHIFHIPHTARTMGPLCHRPQIMHHFFCSRDRGKKKKNFPYAWMRIFFSLKKSPTAYILNTLVKLLYNFLQFVLWKTITFK